MRAIRARLAAIVAGLIIASLTARGVGGLTDEATAQVARWLEHTFEVVFLLGYAIVHPWLQKRWNPTGAYTTDAAHRLEHVARVGREG
jgi:hypothetical protein